MSLALDRLLADGCAEHAVDGRHKVCRSRGGESCAFDGAMIVLQPLADCAHVIHGPAACCANTWQGRGSLSAAGDLLRRGFTSDLSELDIVYGAEGRLREAIDEAVAKTSPRAVFVHSTCVSGLVGEDIDAACREAAERLGLPVIAVNAPGFVGPKNLGNRIAGDVLARQVIGTVEPVVSTPTDIAILGEYNIAGDLWLVEPLLAECGFRLLSRITGDGSFDQVAQAHRARLSVLVCGRALVNVAAHLQRTYGVPWVEASFFGATETSRALRTIAERLEAGERDGDATGGQGLHGLRERTEHVIARHEARLAEELAPHLEVLRGRKAVLYSGGVKSWSMVSALADLGIEVVAVGTKKSSFEDEEKVRAILGEDAPLIENVSPDVLRTLMRERGATILVAGGRNQYLAAKEGWPFVDVNQERHTAYAGYDGLVNLARDLAASVRFFEAHRSLQAPMRISPTALGAAPASGPARGQRAALVDPLKNAASVGAVLAVQGIHRAVPVLHGAQGCSFLEKVLLIKHFREPIALATTKLFTEEVVLGSEAALSATIERFAEGDDRADVVAVVSSALAAVKGDDVRAVVTSFHSDERRAAVVAIDAPDYALGLEGGYLAAVRSLLTLAEDAPVSSRQVTLLGGSHLTPADFVELRELADSFGLRPVIVPDLGALDGSRPAHGPLADGGTTLAELRSLGASTHTLVLGASLEAAARDLEARFGTPFTVLPPACGLAGGDALVAALASLSRREAPPRLARQRRVLVDLMRDAHLRFARVRAALAIEPDAAAHVAALFGECGIEVAQVVLPQQATAPVSLPVEHVVVGGFTDLEPADLVVSNSHAAETCERLGGALLEAGFPSFSLGAAQRVTLGYRGAADILIRIAGLLGRHEPRRSA